MSWLSVITGFVKLASALARWAGDRQLIEAGVAKAVAEGTTNTLAMVEKARKVKDALAGDTDYVNRVRDKYTRK